MLGHADRGQDRIDREDQVEQQDLDDRSAEGRASASRCRRRRRPAPGSTLWWISLVAFQTRNRPPAIRIRSRQEKLVSKPGSPWAPGAPWIPRSKTGAVSPTSQAIPESRTRRMISARLMPIRRARCRWCSRQLVGQDRDEDQIVDAEHHLEHDAGSRARPRPRAGRRWRESRSCQSPLRHFGALAMHEAAGAGNPRARGARKLSTAKSTRGIGFFRLCESPLRRLPAPRPLRALPGAVVLTGDGRTKVLDSDGFRQRAPRRARRARQRQARRFR